MKIDIGNQNKISFPLLQNL